MKLGEKLTNAEKSAAIANNIHFSELNVNPTRLTVGKMARSNLNFTPKDCNSHPIRNRKSGKFIGVYSESTEVILRFRKPQTVQQSDAERYFEYGYASVDIDVLTSLRYLQDDAPGNKFMPYVNSRGWDFDGIFVIKKIRVCERSVEEFKTELSFLYYNPSDFDLTNKISPLNRESGGEVDWSDRFAGDVPPDFAQNYCTRVDAADPEALDALLRELDAKDQDLLAFSEPAAE